jgi:hypothetical protein
MTKFIRLNCLAYGALLIFYPGEFRHRFGAEMVADFEKSMRETILQQGMF